MFKKIIWLIPSIENEIFSSYAKILNQSGLNVSTYCFNERLIELGFPNLLNEIERLSKDYDLILVSLWASSHIISPSFLNKIRQNVFVVLISWDDEIYSTSMSIYYASSIDLVVSLDYFGRGIFDQMGVPTIYNPLQPQRLFKAPDLPHEKSIDVSFIGNSYTADRKKYFNLINSKGFKLEVFGKGSNNGVLTNSEYISVISRSKINLNFTKVLLSPNMLRIEPWRAAMRQYKGRPFEVAQLGSFCLTEWAPNARHMFDEVKHMPIFHDSDDLIEKLNFYLKNEDIRESMALSAHNYSLSNYSAPEAPLKLFNEIYSKLLSKERIKLHQAIIPSVEFLHTANKSFFYSSLAILKRRKIINALKTFFRLLDIKSLLHILFNLNNYFFSRILKK